MRGILIAGFGAIGKTTVSKKYDNVIDLESSSFKYIIDDELKKLNPEERKGLKSRKLNKEFPDNYYNEIMKDLEIYDIVFISMHNEIINLLEENNIKFDKYYWNVEDKLEICKNEKVDIMIDDDWKIIKKLADNEVKTLYFRDTNLMKLEENEYIKEVNNWGEIYRYIRYN